MENKEEKEEKKYYYWHGKKLLISLKIIKELSYFIILGVIILVLISKCSKRTIEYNVASNLISTEEVEKITFAKFTWTGIAKYYKEGKNKVDTFIKYDALVSAFMNVSDLNYNIYFDNDNRIIYVTLPSMELKADIIFKEDGNSFSFIPANSKIDMRDIITICEEDAKKKVNERVQLLDIAKENAKNTIEGLLLPILEKENYQIVWKDGE